MSKNLFALNSKTRITRVLNLVAAGGLAHKRFIFTPRIKLKPAWFYSAGLNVRPTVGGSFQIYQV
jgi:hypothetical protein